VVLRFPVWMVGASLTASLAFATAWFHLSAPSHTHSTAVTIRTFVVLGLPLALFAWALSVWLAQPRGEKGSLALGFAYVVAGVLLALGAARFVSFAPPTEAVFHLRLMWCGLDVFEAVGMALTGWFLHTRSRHVVVAAAATGALLLADAWSNVTATTSTAREAALAMAVVEVSLAVLSVVVAVTVRVRGSPHAPGPPLNPSDGSEQQRGGPPVGRSWGARRAQSVSALAMGTPGR